MDYRAEDQIDSSASGVGNGDLRRGFNGASRSTAPLASPLTLDNTQPRPAESSDQKIMLVTSADDESAWVAPVMRAAAFATIAFQIGYVLLDRGESPQTFARTAPFHVVSLLWPLLRSRYQCPRTRCGIGARWCW